MAKFNVVEKSVEYIPAANGNRELDADEQAVFVLRYMTNGELSRCYETGFVNGEAVVETKSENLIKYGVESIRNLEINGKAITTANEFNKATGMQILYQEIATQVMIQNARIDQGN